MKSIEPSVIGDRRTLAASRDGFPRLVEFVGPAGSGKSSLAEIVSRNGSPAVIGRRYRPTRVSDGLFTLSYGMALAPTWIHLIGRRHEIQKDHLKWMLYLRGWARVLERQSVRQRSTVVVDQGPVFYLATLNIFGPAKLKESKAWWEATYRRWANSLDTIVLLDAPDDVLVERIERRRKPHWAKGRPVAESHRLLQAYRESYEHVISQLSARGDVTVRRFDSSQRTLEDLARQVVATSCCDKLLESPKPLTC